MTDKAAYCETLRIFSDEKMRFFSKSVTGQTDGAALHEAGKYCIITKNKPENASKNGKGCRISDGNGLTSAGADGIITINSYKGHTFVLFAG